MTLTNMTAALMAALIAVAGLAFSTFDASARVIISERTKFYNVKGRTGAQLFRSIQRRGPRGRSFGHAIATTQTELAVRNVKPSVTRGRCRVKSVDVILKLTYTYPRWRNQRRASKTVRDGWNKFMKRVERHELTHGKISKEFARSLEKQILGLTGRVSRNCKDFSRKATRRFQRLERRVQRRHRRFDRREGRATSRVRRLQRRLIASN